MGEDFRNVLRRCAGLAVLALLLLPAVSACLQEPRRPDLSTREDFARSVMDAAVSGSVERVESLVNPGFINAGPEAQQLVDATRGWAPGSWQLGLSNDFPGVANVTASRDGQGPAVRFVISWGDERWALVLGELKNRPSGGAKPIGPGSDPKITGETASPGPTTGAPASPSLPAPPLQTPAACGGTATGSDALSCRSFTSTSGYARGQNMYWLTSAPLHVSFDKMNGLTMVVRMPCGVLNIPVSVDDFGLVPDPAGVAESADGCAGTESDHRSWARAYFKEPMVYHLDSSELVLTNELGQIRFKQD